jgi:hypothetical protein
MQLRTLGMMMLGAVACVTSVAWGRTWVETRLAGFVVMLDRDTQGDLLQAFVRATVQSGTMTTRQIERERVPLATLSPAARVACRTCYDAVFDTYAAAENIPTPTPTSTP